MNYQQPWQYRCEEDVAPLDVQANDDIEELKAVLLQIQQRQLQDYDYAKLISYRYWTLNVAAGLLMAIADRAREHRRAVA